ncbi:RNA polymerase sigma factor [Sphingobacterium pedocola]|uniref:Sigma-70 family RNA polymerase sigma factor n=1 Tax=Sphingobacterium pedocola TaxID=2082722 RepID=A0ABR9T554_9SPHI|nr:RNA polymerase sigma factor [Sphingobacterium pedocola]MBE8720039.1 sigma-70 family RNA polymerase sigma factor [Sphingobacterium pedocola]
MHVDQRYLAYLKNNDRTGIDKIYKNYAKKIVAMIVYNSGTEDDGYDILQEALVDIYYMAKDKDFQLTTSFENFLLMVCKRKWLNALKKKQQIQVTKSTEDLFHIEDESAKEIAESVQQVEKENMVMQLLDTLGERCQEIIRRCMTEKHQEQIAESLGITYAYLRKKKSECMANLISKVKAHPYFNGDIDF